MAWRVVFKAQARKFLSNLGRAEQRKVKAKISLLMNALENAIPPYAVPGLDFKKLKGYQDIFRIRIGSVRIILNIDVNSRTITVLRAGERGKIYKGM